MFDKKKKANEKKTTVMGKQMSRPQVAKALAQKDGHDWDALDDYAKDSYRHYADVVISKGLPIAGEAVKEPEKEEEEEKEEGEPEEDDNPDGAGPDN